MDFVSIRIITTDVARLAGFYERVTGTTATWRAPDVFAEIRTAAATVAVAATSTVPADVVTPATNRSVIIEFRVEDVDALHDRFTAAEIVMPPTTMPWGNRSMLVRDPDGSLVNLFVPADALQKKSQGSS
jgi:uncharacterized glyoxalase superfamily protein PhnB